MGTLKGRRDGVQKQPRPSAHSGAETLSGRNPGAALAAARLHPAHLRGSSRADASVASLNRIERYLMRLTAHELHGHADFLGDDSFRLKASPFPGAIPLGLYELPRRSGEAHLYRLHHPLAEAIVAQAKGRE